MLDVRARSQEASTAGGQRRLTVALLSLPPRTRAVLEFFFMSTGRTAFQPAAEGVAEVLIFDADHPDSRQHWEDLRAQRDVPGIVLSIAEQTLPDTLWVQKPVTAAALLAAAAKVAAQVGRIAATPSAFKAVPPQRAAPAGETQGATTPALASAEVRNTGSAEPSPTTGPVASGVAPATPVGAVAPVLAAQPGQAQTEITAEAETESASSEPEAPDWPERPPAIGQQARAIDAETEARLCGTREDVAPARIHREPELFYAPDALLVGVMRELVSNGRKWRVPVAAEVSGITLVYSPAHSRLYAQCPKEALADLGRRPLEAAVRIRAVDLQEFALLRSREPLTTLERADAYVWELALESAQGRLPAGTSLQQELFLKHWPNLTRLALIPNAFRIAALWGTRGASLLETVRLLGVPQRHVFAFYSAALSLDLVTHDGGHIRQRQKAEAPHKDRGILSKLFGWLKGKR